MDTLRQDLAHVVRFLRQRPLVTLISALSIAIGVGATTAIFSMANALLLQPPAGVGEADRVLDVGRTTGGRGHDTFSYAELLAFRDGAMPPFEALAGVRNQVASYGVSGASEQVLAVAVSQPYFDIMGVRPEVGRFFRPDEDAAVGGAQVAVVSWRFWQDRLGGAPDVAGRTLDINRTTFTIVGVTPQVFRGHIVAASADIWVPLTMVGALEPGFDEFDEPRASWVKIVGRLAPDATVAQARAALSLVMERREPVRDDPRNVRSATAEPLGALPAPARPILGAFIGMLGGLVVIVLLVTCANVAGMLLARGAAREREIAIRVALGSGRGRLIRQLVLESVTLFAIGGLGGIALATWVTGAASSFRLPIPVPLDLDVRPDALVLAAGLGTALLTGLLFGLPPALQASRTDLTGALKLEGRRHGSRTGRLRRVFVTTQIGLSLVLLLSAGLFLRALQRASAVDVGFDPAGVRMAGFDLSTNGYDEARGSAFIEDLRERALALPGVTAAGVASELPLDLSRNGSGAWREEAAGDASASIGTDFASVGPGYFDAAGIRITRGRAFTPADRAGAPAVAVVSRTFADRMWPGSEPIGLRFRFGGPDAPALTVVGLTDDVKNSTLMETPEPMVWLPVLQHFESSLTLLVRSDSDGEAFARALREAILELDPRLAISPVQSFEAYTSIGLLPQRLAAAITGGLGTLALLLSALGIYGVIAFAVALRTREIGIRMALGAHARDVIGLVVRDGIRLAAPGLAVGAVAGLGLGFLVRGFILGVAPLDPVTFVAAPLLLFATVMAACAAPARRAVHVPPTTALRSE